MKGTWLAAAAAAGMVFATQAHAQTEYSFSTWVPAQHPLQPTGLEPWAEAISEASDGRIKITIYPAQQLGAAPDHYDMVRDGIADFGYINPGYQAGRFPVIALGEVPFQIDNATRGSKAFDEWYRQYADKEMADVHFCMAYLHSPGTFHSKEKLTSPADVKGKNIRPAHATMGRFVTMLGGSNVQVSAPESRDALAKGAADAITFPWNSIWLFGIDNVTKHHLDMPMYVTTFVTVMNKARYEAMSPEDKKVIDDHCTPDWAEKVASGWANWEDEGREKALASSDHFVDEPTPEEIQAWKDAAAPLLDQWKTDVNGRGYDADAIYKSFNETLEKNDSRY
ncbi:TRAP transporter substrate-binding protein [Amorphus sp. MBR-141]